MKQIPQNFNHQMPFQPRGSTMAWSPYQQVPMQITPVVQATPKKGLTSLLSKLNPANGNLSQALDHIHQLIKMGQSISPKIKEYAPLIKSIPAMLELMKEFDEDEDGGTTEEMNNDPESTAELDAILGINDEDDFEIIEKQDQVKQSKTSNKMKNNRIDDLFKIETTGRNQEYVYRKPKLYI